MDAPLVRAYLEALPDVAPDDGSVERARTCLTSLLGPDVRYLVGLMLGPGGWGTARVCAAVLREAGARTGVLGPTLGATLIDGVPMDEPLFARAGTLAAASGYQLADTSAHLGELTRREASVILALTAFAEANLRVALLVDEDIRPSDPLHAARPDLVVIGRVDAAGIGRALALVPEGRPVVIASLVGEPRDRAEARVSELGTPALLGDRDYRLDERDGHLDLIVRGERFVTLDPVPGIERWELATGVAAALGLGVLGIRMREEWVLAGIASLRAEPVAP